MKISNVVYPLNYSDSFWTSNFGFLKGFIMSTLGHPLVRVELTEAHLIQSIHNAISQYYKYNDNLTSLTLEMATLDENGEAPLPPRVDIELVRDVFFTESTNAFGFTTPIDEGVVATFPLSSFLNMNGGIFDLGQYYMARQNLEDANIITGRNKTWMFLNGKIKVFPVRLASDSKMIGILCGKLLGPDEIENDDWLRDYSVAYAKMLLGTIRRKFSGFSAGGGASTNDGDTLITEGKTEMAELIASKKESRGSISFLQV
jgi:hypothetical protein